MSELIEILENLHPEVDFDTCTTLIDDKILDSFDIVTLVAEIDAILKTHSDESLSLKELAHRYGYSEFHFLRRFKELSGMAFRDYVRYRRLAFALKRVRDTRDGLLEIALDHGFSSHEAFTRAFREAYGITPRQYRNLCSRLE